MQTATHRAEQQLLRLLPDDMAILAGGVPTVLGIVSDRCARFCSCRCSRSARNASAKAGDDGKKFVEARARLRHSGFSSASGSRETDHQAARSDGLGLVSNPANDEAEAVARKQETLGRFRSAKRLFATNSS